jgi:hypothetical protein
MFAIDKLIWSYNRACQLDLLLRSTKDYFKNVGTVFVLWKADDDLFRSGYEIIMKRHYGLDVRFIKETDFEGDIKDILSNEMQTEYVLGNSDDNVFINMVEFDHLQLKYNAVAFSLRLGETIDFSLPVNLKLKIPKFNKYNGYLLWNWSESDSRGCWGYPHPVDSNIYRREYWVDLLKNGHFKNPKTMEEYMNEHRNYKYQFMQSFHESKLISISSNELGQGSNLVTGGTSLSELNKKFLDGYIISTNNIYSANVSSCHVIIDYKWEKNEN